MSMTDVRRKHLVVPRLADTAGETLAETLVALLVASLALVILATSIGAATRIVLRTEATAKSYYAATNTLVEGAGSVSGTGSVSISTTTSDSDITLATTTVNVTWVDAPLPGGKTGVSYRLSGEVSP